MNTTEYVLGSSTHELERLALQHQVWKASAAELFELAGLQPGWRVLDAGCGPGLALDLLRQGVGERGTVLALDASPRWIAEVRTRIRERGWGNVRVYEGSLEDAQIVPESFELIYLRWVLSFPPNPEAIVQRLADWLRPGGVLVVQDYNHEGCSLFPESAGFRAIVRATRALIAGRGGNAFIAGELPRLVRRAGLVLEQLEPRVLCGGPGSAAMRWADAFFPYHSASMVEAGVLSAEERELFLREWQAALVNPDATFYSPIVVGALARKPGSGA